jgi:hypothetical protein
MLPSDSMTSHTNYPLSERARLFVVGGDMRGESLKYRFIADLSEGVDYEVL